jgi:hypothetical protein
VPIVRASWTMLKMVKSYAVVGCTADLFSMTYHQHVQAIPEAQSLVWFEYSLPERDVRSTWNWSILILTKCKFKYRVTFPMVWVQAHSNRCHDASDCRSHHRSNCPLLWINAPKTNKSILQGRFPCELWQEMRCFMHAVMYITQKTLKMRTYWRTPSFELSSKKGGSFGHKRR